MSKDTAKVLSIGVVLTAFLLFMVAGWLMNLSSVWNATEFDLEMLIRGVGIVIPFVGGVLGWV